MKLSSWKIFYQSHEYAVLFLFFIALELILKFLFCLFTVPCLEIKHEVVQVKDEVKQEC